MPTIPEVDQDLLNSFFDANIQPKIRFDHPPEGMAGFSDEELSAVRRLLANKSCVLGIDIYHYSQYADEKRVFVPFVFEEILAQCVSLISQNFPFLFQKCDLSALRDSFIQTGDGGFLALETPLHAIVFAVTFETVVRMYNSLRFMRRLRAKVGEIIVRYAIAYDNVYTLHKRLYGAAIITCARLLRRDKLNRMLIDSYTFDWFTEMMMGIENLQNISIRELRRMPPFAYYQEPKSGDYNALIPTDRFLNPLEGIKAVDVQKIGFVKEKDTPLDVYNLHLQATIEYTISIGTKVMFAVTIGNSNPSGIPD